MISTLMHPSFTRLQRFVDHEIADPPVALHIVGCQKCRTRVEELRSLSADLRNLPSPEARPKLGRRILESRASGVRVILPADGAIQRRRVSLRFVIGAAAALVVGIFLATERQPQPEREQRAVTSILAGVPFWPSAAAAQLANATPKYGLIQIDASQLEPGEWEYDAAAIIDGTLRNNPHRVVYSLASGFHHQTAAWVIVSGGMAGYVDRKSLQFLYNTRRGAWGADTEYQVGDSTFATIVRVAAGKYPAMVQRKDARLPTGTIPFVSMKPLLQSLPLTSSWRGSVRYYWMAPLLSGIEFPVLTLDLRVEGTERVTVPAGVFDCWKVRVSLANADIQAPSYTDALVWVSRKEHWVVQMRDQFTSDTRYEEQLIRHTTPPAP